MSYKDREKQREYQRNKNASVRQQYFSDKCCVNCGSKDKLELDHINRTEKVSHRIWSWSRSKREAEIAKCQVLCHDCHVEKTKKDMGYQKVTHGTASMYDYYKCRCDLCKNAKRLVNARRSKNPRGLSQLVH